MNGEDLERCDACSKLEKMHRIVEMPHPDRSKRKVDPRYPHRFLRLLLCRACQVTS